MGSIVMTEIKVDNVVNVAGSGKPNFPVSPTHSSGSALSTLNTCQYDTTARVVTVVSSGGNKYAIDGVTTPTITLLRGVTYVFDVSDSSNSGHPLAFKNSGSSYTTGVVTSGTAGQSGATVTFTVAANAPLTGLTYYCTTHGDSMGSSLTTSDPKNGALVWDSAAARPMVYINSEFKNIQLNTALPSALVWWGTRGMAIAGQQPGNSNIMQYFDITSTGNAVDFGDLTTTDYSSSAGGNGSRGVRIGGTSNNTTMDYWAFATTGNAVDFGDPLVARQLSTTVADGTKAITAGSVAGGYKNDIEYITVATTGNGTDFGDLNRSTAGISSTNDTTRGVFAGDQSTSSNAMDYITMATPGNATDYGDLATTNNNMLQGVVSDNTYGVFMGGVGGGSYSNVIQYMTIQSSSNATDFGDIAQARAYGGQTSDATSKRGVTLGGYVNPGSGGVALDSIEYITINTPGNAQDFGDLTGGNERACGVSGAAS